LESVVQSQKDSLTADFEARMKVNMDQARVQAEDMSRVVAEKTLALESMQTELKESRQTNLERVEELLRDIETVTTERDDIAKVFC
jgi:hypothetical protein